MRFILLSVLAVACYTLAMTYEPEPIRYSQAETDGMAKLVARSLVKHKMTREERAEALQQLFVEGNEKM